MTTSDMYSLVVSILAMVFSAFIIVGVLTSPSHDTKTEYTHCVTYEYDKTMILCQKGPVTR